MNKKHKEDLEQQLAKFHEVVSNKCVLMPLLKGVLLKSQILQDKFSLMET